MKLDNRIFIVTVILVAIISFTIGVAVDVTSPATNSVPVYNGSTWDASGTDSDGILVIKDSNTVCFANAGSCDINVMWDGTNLILNGGD
jgi:hypothetical protein